MEKQSRRKDGIYGHVKNATEQITTVEHRVNRVRMQDVILFPLVLKIVQHVMDFPRHRALTVIRLVQEHTKSTLTA
jgi:hypothetical protein